MYQTFIAKEQEGIATATFNRRSLNTQALKEINHLLDAKENDAQCCLIILEGNEEFFCTGLDLQEVVLKEEESGSKISEWTHLFMTTLNRFRTYPKVIVAHVAGKAIAGGVGLVAASDLVIASPNASFKLSEVLWGLIPAMIAPFLMRRIGAHQTSLAAITHRTISASEAQEMGLVDRIETNPSEEIMRFKKRLDRVDNATIRDLKAYFHQIEPKVNTALAVAVTTERLLSPEVQLKLRKEFGNLPS